MVSLVVGKSQSSVENGKWGRRDPWPGRESTGGFGPKEEAGPADPVGLQAGPGLSVAVPGPPPPVGTH